MNEIKAWCVVRRDISLSLSRSQQAEKRIGWRGETGGGWGDVGGWVSRGITLIFKTILQHRQSFTSSAKRGYCQDLENTTLSAQVMQNWPKSTFCLQSMLSNTRLKAAGSGPRGCFARGTDTEFNKRSVSPHSHSPDPTSPPDRLPHFKYSVFSFFISLWASHENTHPSIYSHNPILSNLYTKYMPYCMLGEKVFY